MYVYTENLFAAIKILQISFLLLSKFFEKFTTVSWIDATDRFSIETYKIKALGN